METLGDLYKFSLYIIINYPNYNEALTCQLLVHPLTKTFSTEHSLEPFHDTHASPFLFIWMWPLIDIQVFIKQSVLCIHKRANTLFLSCPLPLSHTTQLDNLLLKCLCHHTFGISRSYGGVNFFYLILDHCHLYIHRLSWIMTPRLIV